jgi:hypothetical protein
MRLRPQLERLEDRLALAVFFGAPNSPSPNQLFVANAYNDGLNRPVDAAGLNNWTGALQGGGLPTQVALGIAASQKFLTAEWKATDIAGSNLLTTCPELQNLIII